MTARRSRSSLMRGLPSVTHARRSPHGVKRLTVSHSSRQPIDAPNLLERDETTHIARMHDGSGFGTDLAERSHVNRSLDDSASPLRLPRPPRSPGLDLKGVSPSGEANGPAAAVGAPPDAHPDYAPLAAPAPLAVSVGLRRELSRSRPSLEALLGEAESLANALSVSDPRGRLLQVALLRRDYTLLEAILSSLGRLAATLGTAPRTIRPGANRNAALRTHASPRQQATADGSAKRPKRRR